MNTDSDTRILERDQMDTTRWKKNPPSVSPLWFLVGALIVLIVVAAAIVKKTIREKEAKATGVMTATYANAKAREFVADGPVMAPPNFNHVIFRLGDEEIFRFTYEDGGDGRRCSFEIREGGS
jgi:flagellar biosynthesis/type III secretory pathway M-ring protein FliF/YscJ